MTIRDKLSSSSSSSDSDRAASAGVPAPRQDVIERIRAGICGCIQSGSAHTCREQYGVGSWCSACLGHALIEAVGEPVPQSQPEAVTLLRQLVMSYDTDESLEFLEALVKSRDLLGLKLADEDEDREDREALLANGLLQPRQSAPDPERRAAVGVPAPPSTQEWTEEQFADQVKTAMAYVNKIVVESDGYPETHSAGSLRTLLVNAFISGMEAVSGGHQERTQAEVSASVSHGREDSASTDRRTDGPEAIQAASGDVGGTQEALKEGPLFRYDCPDCGPICFQQTECFNCGAPLRAAAGVPARRAPQQQGAGNETMQSPVDRPQGTADAESARVASDRQQAARDESGRGLRLSELRRETLPEVGAEADALRQQSEKKT